MWRAFSLNKQDYTYYSAQHNSYSRIDLILVTKDIQQEVESTNIEPRIFSDHATVKIFWQGKEKLHSRPVW